MYHTYSDKSKIKNSTYRHELFIVGCSTDIFTASSPSFTNLKTDNIIHTHTRLTALFPGLPGWAGTRKVKPIWILLKQETVSGSGISLAICKSAPCSRQITTPAPHHSVFYRPDALPAAQPTVSKHWRARALNILLWRLSKYVEIKRHYHLLK